MNNIILADLILLNTGREHLKLLCRLTRINIARKKRKECELLHIHVDINV